MLMQTMMLLTQASAQTTKQEDRGDVLQSNNMFIEKWCVEIVRAETGRRVFMKIGGTGI